MKKINLTQGKYALVDDEDFESLNQWEWCASKSRQTFYALRDIGKSDGFGRKHLRMHRVLLGDPKNLEIDHIDGDGLNNQRNNLRVASRKQNRMNSRSPINRGPGLKGVCWHKRDKKWQSQIKMNGKTKYLGTFTLATEAAHAYDKAARKYFGEFARLNSAL